MNVAVIGGGINGIMTAWELLKQGHSVTLYEKGEVMKQTSSASSKLLHGGLRYLENYEFRLVQEALIERQWWIQQIECQSDNLDYHSERSEESLNEESCSLAHPLKLYIPVYQSSRRSGWMYKLGLWLYDTLAGKQNIGKHQSLSKQRMHQACSQLKTQGLKKGFSFYDGQMDDYQLGTWALDQAKKQLGLVVQEHTEVVKVDVQGNLTLANGSSQTFDKIINIAGPWAEQLLIQSHIKTECNLDLVRGSHILVETNLSHGSTQINTDKETQKNIRENPCSSVAEEHGYLLEVPNERRIFFVLPYQGKTLIGTTEERQSLNDDIKPSEQEIDYLINAYNHYFKTPISRQDIVQSFAGLRPLIKSADNPSKATREYAIQQNQNLITVLGGKWTTARQLGIKVVGLVK
jgi:glycerol-3-phosphate dehydrogenase